LPKNVTFSVAATEGAVEAAAADEVGAALVGAVEQAEREKQIAETTHINARITPPICHVETGRDLFIVGPGALILAEKPRRIQFYIAAVE